MNWTNGTTLRIGDGAIGTRLQEVAGRTMPCPEALVLETEGRRLLAAVHAEYLAAGAQWIETHTFAANPWRLRDTALQDQCALINRLAAETARAAATAAAANAAGTVVLGSVGPLDYRHGGGQPPTASELEACYRPQIEALADAGVDGFILETFTRPQEAEAALRCAAVTGLPVLFAIGGQSAARSFARRTVTELVDLADRLGAAAIGLNCLPPYDISRLLPLIAERTRRPLLAMPNAGTPQVLRGCIRYDLGTDELLREAEHWIRLGAAFVGGCCGTRPEHIRALSERFRDRPIESRTPAGQAAPAATTDHRERPRPSTVSVGPAAQGAAADGALNPVRQVLARGGRPLLAVEIRPALQRPFQETVARLKPVADAGPDYFDIPDNPGANPGRDSLVCSHLLQQAYRIPVIAHRNPTQANALRLTAELLSAADLGVRGILAVSGDPPHIGPFDRVASRVSDIRNAVELLDLLRLMRQGEMINGQPLPAPIDFCAGCALAPSLSLKSQVAWLEKKIEAGAEFVFTQPVFDRPTLDRLREAIAGRIRIPVLIGIFPVVSARQAAFLQAGKIPGIVMPPAAAEAIAKFDAADDQAAAGLDQARSLIEHLTASSNGIYLVMPFHPRSVAMTAELVSVIRDPSLAPTGAR